jgi:Pentapeptide repeats (8 copies)
MIRALGILFVTVGLLATPVLGFARVVQSGFAPRPVFVHPGFARPAFVNPGFVNRGFVNPGFVNRGFIRPGFVNRGFVAPLNYASRRFFLAGPGVVVVPYPYYPYPLNAGYPPCPCYVAP